eukprot:3937046-Prymnesium_polylepis.1
MMTAVVHGVRPDSDDDDDSDGGGGGGGGGDDDDDASMGNGHQAVRTALVRRIPEIGAGSKRVSPHLM